jgi:hypothetical protein
MKKLTTQEHLSKHDRELDAIRKLMKHGMRMLVRLEDQFGAHQTAVHQEQLAFRKEMRELAAAQKRTDAALKAFIESLKRGGNGHSKRAVELQ